MSYEQNIANHKIQVYWDWVDGKWYMTDECRDDPRQSWSRMCDTKAQAERYARIAVDMVEEEARHGRV